MFQLTTRFLLPLAALCCTVQAAEKLEWKTDYAAALEEAKQENKHVLFFFTGSDWCGWCNVMKEKVLGTPAFVEYVKDRYVPMEIDMPKQTPQEPALRAQNEKLAAQLNVRAYPSLFVMRPQDAFVTAVVKSGYDNPIPVLERLEPADECAKAYDAVVKSLEGKSDAQQAQLLFDFYKQLQPDVRSANRVLYARIIELDKEDSLGLHAEVARQKRLVEQTATYNQRLAKVREGLTVDDKDYWENSILELKKMEAEGGWEPEILNRIKTHQAESEKASLKTEGYCVP